MLAYVELIQRREKEIGCDVLTHQKWSGASYVDRILQSKLACLYRNVEAVLMVMLELGVTAGSSSTLASGADSTESQFH